MNKTNDGVIVSAESAPIEVSAAATLTGRGVHKGTPLSFECDCDRVSPMRPASKHGHRSPLERQVFSVLRIGGLGMVPIDVAVDESKVDDACTLVSVHIRSFRDVARVPLIIESHQS